jgi:hypothetical protein
MSVDTTMQTVGHYQARPVADRKAGGLNSGLICHRPPAHATAQGSMSAGSRSLHKPSDGASRTWKASASGVVLTRRTPRLRGQLVVMHLTDSARSERVHRLVDVLTSAYEGSVCVPIGSIGRGDADIYSDIDLEWTFPAGRWVGLNEVTATLAQVAPVESLRYDPDYDRSPDARLVFVRYSTWPLFSRVDVFIRADFQGEEGPVGTWSPLESVLMNVLGCGKGDPSRSWRCGRFARAWIRSDRGSGSWRYGHLQDGGASYRCSRRRPGNSIARRSHPHRGPVPALEA